MTDSTVHSPTADLAGWADDLGDDQRRALTALGELLVGVTGRPSKVERADIFTIRCLGSEHANQIVDEEREMNGVQRLTVGLALTELIKVHSPEIGPGEHFTPPGWTEPRSARGRTTTHSCSARHSPPAPCIPPCLV